MSAALAWSLLAALGLPPALAALLVVLGPPLAGIAALWRRGRRETAPGDRDEAVRSAGRGLVGAVFVAAAELLLSIGATTLVGVPAPWPTASGAAFGGGLAWLVVIRRIPPAAGYRLTPALVAACAGAGLGALLAGLWSMWA